MLLCKYTNTLKMSLEKSVSYTATNTYTTLNNFSEQTQNIWLVCHGLGYLSKYFIKYFEILDPEANYVIAPQAPSKYYQDKSFKYVGANWVTREQTQMDVNNVLHYMDAVYNQEVKPILTNQIKFIVLGYSQGVSVVTRWVAQHTINCDQLILHSGGLPKELKADSFSHLNPQVPVHLIYGTQDEYINEQRLAEENKLATAIFDSRLHIHKFEGVHEVNPSLIKTLVNS